MNVNGKNYRSLWFVEGGNAIEIIDQTRLPHTFSIVRLSSLEQIAQAIRDMKLRGAPLIGAAAACGMALAARASSSEAALLAAGEQLCATRPTAINLRWAVERLWRVLLAVPDSQRPAAAMAEALAICTQDIACNQRIGQHGLSLLRSLHDSAVQPLNLLTHCNAGWLATVDWGTALAPVYAAYDVGLPLHVWVDETRPRNQGAALTAWELGQHGVPHTVIADNAGGHLMQHGRVDAVIVGADRVTRTGDVCNKIGTYLKALAAFDNGIPFYVAAPSSTIDWSLADGLREIPIEQRGAEEVAWVHGRLPNGEIGQVNVLAPGSVAANPAFDVTPARLVTAIITEHGLLPPSQLAEICPAVSNQAGGRA